MDNDITDTERLDFIAKNTQCSVMVDGEHVWWPTTFKNRLIGASIREAIDKMIRKERQDGLRKT